MSDSSAYEIAETFFVQAERGCDLVSFLNGLATEKDIDVGAFTAIGALQSARLAFYDQEARRYIELVDLQAPQELISCMGTISIRDGKPFAHAHVVLVDAEGNTRAGHLLEGRVFFAQVCLNKLAGPED